MPARTQTVSLVSPCRERAPSDVPRAHVIARCRGEVRTRTAIEEAAISKARRGLDSQFPCLITVSPKPVCHLFNLSIASAAIRRTSLVGVVLRRAATRLEARRSGSCCRWCNSCRSRRTLASKSTGRSPSGVDALSLLQWPPAAILAFLEGILPRRCVVGGRPRPPRSRE